MRVDDYTKKSKTPGIDGPGLLGSENSGGTTSPLTPRGKNREGEGGFGVDGEVADSSERPGKVLKRRKSVSW